MIAFGLMVVPVDLKAQSAGALQNGMSAAAAGRGGTMVAEPGDALDAIEGNPAGLAGIHGKSADIGAVGLAAIGTFRNSANPDNKLSGQAGVLPLGAYAQRIGNSPFTGAVGFTPDALIRVNWRYNDPAGTAGVSYGLQPDKSQIIALRSSAGLGWAINRKWSAGATVGLIYNTNHLNAPYIFQQQAELKGLKVLLDLDSRGFGWNGSAGLQFRPSERVGFGAAWKSATYVQSHGDASGTASALFTAIGVTADPTFHYKAEVDNHFPQIASAGGFWQATSHARIGLEGDWVGWSGAFETLPVKLKDGTNAVINSVVGSDAMTDAVPLNWKNQVVARTGVEYSMPRGWAVRGGYSYMSNPVPSSTLTPMTAAILRNSLAAGAGWSRERVGWNVAYTAELPASQSVGTSALQAGEYNNSHVRVMTQAVTATVRLRY